MISRENINIFWASLIVEELVRNGVEFFCISPGSRSTPLTVAAARHPAAQTMMCHDERGAGFLALGYGKAAGRPAVLICTSGSAAANYYPAIIEAAMDDTPLLVFTADRPPELIGSGANQTIFQDNIYGVYPRWATTLPTPSQDIPAEYLLQMIDRAFSVAVAQRGPVHINCPFREPLEPSPKKFRELTTEKFRQWLRCHSAFSSQKMAKPACSDEVVADIAWTLNNAKQPLLILGRRAPSLQHSTSVTRFVQRLRWPIHADIASGYRLGSPFRHRANVPAIQHSPPDVVLHLGGAFVSKQLQQALKIHPPGRYIHVYEQDRRIDPGNLVSDRLVCSIDEFCENIQLEISTGKVSAPEAKKTSSESWEQDMSEAAIAQLVSRHFPAGHALFLSNSQPVRDMDDYAVPDGEAAIVGTNRGASGIDGIVASAVGFARGLQQPTTLIIGDTAFLHDLNSLQLVANSAPPLTIVCINNNGGGIFRRLPIADFDDVFEDYFVAPHNRSFEHAARMFGLPWLLTHKLHQLQDALTAAWASGRSQIIECRLA